MGIRDSIRRFAGLPTSVEIGEAEASNDRIRRSSDPRDRFASSVADGLTSLATADAKLVLPGLRDVSLSEEPAIRWQTIGHAARELADDSLRQPVQSLDQPLSRAVGERALIETAERIDRYARYRPEADLRVGKLLEDTREEVARNTQAFMSEGTASETNASVQSRDFIHNAGQPSRVRLNDDVRDLMPRPGTMDGREWLEKAVRVRMAAAQTGILSPERTVSAAMDAASQGHVVLGRISQVPDRTNLRSISPADRDRMIADRVARNATPRPPAPVLTTEEQLARHGITATRSEGKGPSQSDRAAIARGMSDPSRSR